MPATATQLCADIDCLCTSGAVQNDLFKLYVLQLLCNLVAGEGGTTTPLVSSSGTTTSVPAGARSVTVQSVTGVTTANGITIPQGTSYTLTAPPGFTLPAITITGTAWNWNALT